MLDSYDRQGGRVVMRDQVCILEEQVLCAYYALQGAVEISRGSTIQDSISLYQSEQVVD